MVDRRGQYLIDCIRSHRILGFMSTSYAKSHKNKYRITLEIEAQEDFNPHQIDWKKLFELKSNERVKSYVEDFNYR